MQKVASVANRVEEDDNSETESLCWNDELMADDVSLNLAERFNDNELKLQIGCLEQRIKNLETAVQKLTVPTCSGVLVFLATGAVQQEGQDGVTYSAQRDVGSDFYGTFDKSTGVFEAKHDGVYQFNFWGAVNLEVDFQFELLVNDIDQTGPLPESYTTTWNTITVSTSFPLLRGDKVRVVMTKGSLFNSSANRFWCSFISSIARFVF